jgi:hypothetical protein
VQLIIKKLGVYQRKIKVAQMGVGVLNFALLKLTDLCFI